jgi:hypothetical protein
MMNVKNNTKMYKTSVEWKWTKGEPYDRSMRPSRSDENISKEVESAAYEISLNHDENSWEIMNQNLFDKNFVQFSKREDTDKKLAERQMICQVNMNPYLTNNNYVNDLSVHDQFLKPISTNFGRENVESLENNDK